MFLAAVLHSLSLVVLPRDCWLKFFWFLLRCISLFAFESLKKKNLLALAQGWMLTRLQESIMEAEVMMVLSLFGRLVIITVRGEQQSNNAYGAPQVQRKM